MKNIFTAILCLIVLFSLGACRNFLKPELGAIAQEDARFSLSDGGIESGLLKTRQLQLDYNLSTTENSFTISGTMIVDRSVYSSFPIVERFFLKINFLDEAGRVLGTSDISPVLSTGNYISETQEFKRSGEFPAGSTAVAFNYFGSFAAENLDTKGDSWEVFYFPFE